MEKCSPVKMRENITAANAFAKAGIDFVCIPVLNDGEKAAFGEISMKQLDRIIELSEEK